MPEDGLEQKEIADKQPEIGEEVGGGEEELTDKQRVKKRILEIIFNRFHDPDRATRIVAGRESPEGDWVAEEVTGDGKELSPELVEKGETILGEKGVLSEEGELSPELEALKKKVMAGKMELPEFLQEAAEISGLNPEEFEQKRLDRINDKLSKEYANMGEFEAAVESGEVDIDPQQLEILKDHPELNEFFAGSEEELPEPPKLEEEETKEEEEKEETKEEEKINMEEVRRKADWVFEMVNKRMKGMGEDEFYKELESQSEIDWGKSGKPGKGELTSAMKQKMVDKSGVEQDEKYYKNLKKNQKPKKLERIFGRNMQRYDELIKMVAKTNTEAAYIRAEVYGKVLKRRRVNAFKLEVASYTLDSVGDLGKVMLNMVSSALQAELQGGGAAG